LRQIVPGVGQNCQPDAWPHDPDDVSIVANKKRYEPLDKENVF